MPIYIHQKADWPVWRWDHDALAPTLSDIRHRQGRLLGRMESLGFALRQQATLRTLTDDAVKTSEIEGGRLDTEQVRSSVARRLGIALERFAPQDRHVDGLVEVLLDATQSFAQPLTPERLWGWHAALFPTGYNGLKRIVVGGWRGVREDPMQVVSGALGRERVHVEAPTADRLDREMGAFLDWFNAPATATTTDPVLIAAIAHLWFITLHPFEDGNGRLARAIADLALARSEGSAQRFYSLSAQIRQDRRSYYEQLERTQKGALDLTAWLAWFLACLGRSLAAAEAELAVILNKAAFWDAVRTQPLNERQRRVLNRLLDGLDGKLTSSRWAKLAGCSQDTALRDLQGLVQAGLLQPGAAGGRSTCYVLGLATPTRL